jgi:positive regulator of sigma E activity
MKELGFVIKTEKGRATVKVDKKDECSRCGLCLFPKNATSVEFSVNNGVGAKEGDTVMIETKENSKLLRTLRAFLVPLILTAIAAVITLTIIKEETYMLIISAVSIAIWYAILPSIDKRLKKSNAFAPDIIQIIENKKD